MSKSIWYMASTIGTKVNEVVVVSETTHRVTLQYHDWSGQEQQKVVAKRSNYENYFKTKDEAWDFILSCRKDDVIKAENSLKYMVQTLERALKNKENEDDKE